MCVYEWIHHGLVTIKFNSYPRKSVWLRCVEIQCHTSNTCSKWVQITALFHLSRYYIRHCDNSGRKWNTFSNHNKHPISRPHGRAMGCLLWGFWRKLPALLWHRALLFCIFCMWISSFCILHVSIRYRWLFKKAKFNEYSMKVTDDCDAKKI